MHVRCSMSSNTTARDARRPVAPREGLVRRAQVHARTPWRTSNLTRCRAASFFPASELQELQEAAALDLAARYTRVPVPVPTWQADVDTGVIPARHAATPGVPPLLLLHSFDSSGLEWRRLLPLLDGQGQEVWAVDQLGSGFSDSTALLRDPSLEVSPKARAAHLAAFVGAHLGGRPALVLGASLGGSLALELALNHPQVVAGLVLVAAQGFTRGLGPAARLPVPLLRGATTLLRSKMVRRTKSIWHDKALGTEDSMLIGRLHTHLPGWSESLVQFMRSGGYNLEDRLSQVSAPTLVLWGRQDEVLGTEQAGRFEATMPAARVEWINACGHFPHLEQARAVAAAVQAFTAELAAQPVAAAQPAAPAQVPSN